MALDQNIMTAMMHDPGTEHNESNDALPWKRTTVLIDDWMYVKVGCVIVCKWTVCNMCDKNMSI